MKSMTLLLLPLLAAYAAEPAPAARAPNVSLIALVADPGRFDGKPGRVGGFLQVETDQYALYVHQDDEKQGIRKNGVWVDLPKSVRAKPGDYDERYALIEGIFSAKYLGPKDGWSGSIESVSRVELWGDAGGKDEFPLI